jgi:hypothetical protein
MIFTHWCIWPRNLVSRWHCIFYDTGYIILEPEASEPGNQWISYRKSGKCAAEDKSVRLSKHCRAQMSYEQEFRLCQPPCPVSAGLLDSGIVLFLWMYLWYHSVNKKIPFFFGIWHSYFSWLTWLWGWVSCTLTGLFQMGECCEPLFPVSCISLFASMYWEVINGKDKHMLSDRKFILFPKVFWFSELFVRCPQTTYGVWTSVVNTKSFCVELCF